MLNATWSAPTVLLLLHAITALGWGVPPSHSCSSSPTAIREKNNHWQRWQVRGRRAGTWTLTRVRAWAGGGGGADRCISVSYCSFDIMTMTHGQFRFWVATASRTWNTQESADICTETYWRSTEEGQRLYWFAHLHSQRRPCRPNLQPGVFANDIACLDLISKKILYLIIQLQNIPQ